MTPRFFRFGTLVCAVVAAACTGSITGPDGTNNSPGSTPVGGVTPAGGNTVPVAGATPETQAVAAAAVGKIKIDGNPSYYRVLRLTNKQWTNSVQSVLQLAAAPTNAETFQEAVSGTTDFTNNELVLDIDSRGWSDFEAAAEALAKQVTSDAAQLSKLYSGTDGAGFIAAMGRRFYRRPLVAAETAAYQKLFDMGPTFSGTQSAFAKGASVVLEAMLQSPYFLYRSELGAVGAPLTAYEMAAKLSLWLRNTTPDDALLDAAGGSGKLDTPDGAVAAATKMLDEPGARDMMRTFHGEFMRFGKFSQIDKVGVANYNANINADLAESSYLFYDRIFSQGLGVKDIFLSTTGFVAPTMAALYGGGVAAPASGYAQVDLGPTRTGYFQQLPFLVLYGHNALPDMIHRGVSIALDVLCAPLGPPAVIPTLPDVMPGQTNRQRIDTTTGACGASCHNNMINPLGAAFENFDGMGQYRQTEQNGSDMLTIDPSASFTFIDGVKSYKNAGELMSVLASDPQSHLCYAKKLASFGLQRDMIESDLPMLAALSADSAAGTASVKQVVLGLVKQDAFRTRAGGAK